jgi:hypothetical protein
MMIKQELVNTFPGQDRASAFTFMFRKTTKFWKNFYREVESNRRFAGEEAFALKSFFPLPSSTFSPLR